MEKHLCPACGGEMSYYSTWCAECGYTKKPITIPQKARIRINPHWRYQDSNGKQHNVVAIEVNMRTFHFGDGENRLTRPEGILGAVALANVTVDGRGRVLIPGLLRKHADIHSGDTLVATQTVEGKIVLEKSR